MTDTIPDYGAIAAMRASASLKGRVVACADLLAPPVLGDEDALGWGGQQYPTIVADSDWSTAWAAGDQYNPDGTLTDKGARSDVITDQMIHDRVSELLAAVPMTDAPAS